MARVVVDPDVVEVIPGMNPLLHSHPSLIPD